MKNNHKFPLIFSQTPFPIFNEKHKPPSERNEKISSYLYTSVILYFLEGCFELSAFFFLFSYLKSVLCKNLSENNLWVFKRVYDLWVFIVKWVSSHLKELWFIRKLFKKKHYYEIFFIFLWAAEFSIIEQSKRESGKI